MTTCTLAATKQENILFHVFSLGPWPVDLGPKPIKHNIDKFIFQLSTPLSCSLCGRANRNLLESTGVRGVVLREGERKRREEVF